MQLARWSAAAQEWMSIIDQLRPVVAVPLLLDQQMMCIPKKPPQQMASVNIYSTERWTASLV